MPQSMGREFQVEKIHLMVTTLLKKSNIDPHRSDDNDDQSRHSCDDGLDIENYEPDPPEFQNVVQSEPYLAVDGHYAQIDKSTQHRYTDPGAPQSAMGCNTQREVSSGYKGHFDNVFRQRHQALISEQEARVKAYKGLLLPPTIFKPTPRWATPSRTPTFITPDNIHDDDLSYYMGTLQNLCPCDQTYEDTCPLHGKGNPTLKSWANNLLKIHTFARHGVVLSQSNLLKVSRMSHTTSTPSEEGDGSKIDVSTHFSQEKDVSVIESVDKHGVFKREVKQQLRQTLETELGRGNDSGLKQNLGFPPLTDQTLANSGGVSTSNVEKIKESI